MDEMATEGRQRDDAEVVPVPSGRHLVADLDVTAQFLKDLPLKGHTRSLARLDLPAWKLPHSTKRSPISSPGAQNQALTLDDRTHDNDLLAHPDLPKSGRA